MEASLSAHNRCDLRRERSARWLHHAGEQRKMLDLFLLLLAMPSTLGSVMHGHLWICQQICSILRPGTCFLQLWTAFKAELRYKHSWEFHILSNLSVTHSARVCQMKAIASSWIFRKLFFHFRCLTPRMLLENKVEEIKRKKEEGNRFFSNPNRLKKFW